MLQQKQSIDVRNNRKRRVESERRVEDRPFLSNSRHQQAYTNIDLDPPDLEDSRAKRNYDHDLDPHRDNK
jgi:hypothetical protein